MISEKKIILVVDDAPENIDVISGALKAHYKVKASTSGERALKIAARVPQPDLILLDVMMPDMDGYETCKRLKADPETSDIHVVFVTGADGDAERKRGLSAGAVDYVTKPINPVSLLELLQSHLQ
jgi:putative two-component system response regulator